MVQQSTNKAVSPSELQAFCRMRARVRRPDPFVLAGRLKRRVSGLSQGQPSVKDWRHGLGSVWN